MAIELIVEDGTGVADANTYLTAEYVSEYAETIGSAVWDDNESKQAVALIQATRFIDMKYRGSLQGTIMRSTQGLLWPRSSFVDTNGKDIVAGSLPKALKDAVAHAAIMYLENGTLDLNANSGNNIKSSSVKVGGGAVEESVTYFAPSETNVFSVIDGYMAPLLSAASRSRLTVNVVRG